MEAQILIAGFGGQGVLLMGQLLAKAAMENGMEVSWLPSYGPEMRGGEANCAVVISDAPIGSPLVTNPPIAILMNKPSMLKFMPMMKPGGVLFYNASLITDVKPREDVTAYPVPCGEIAERLENPRVANMAMLGAVLEATRLLPIESVVRALEKTLGESKRHLIPVNERAVAEGAAAVRGERAG